MAFEFDGFLIGRELRIADWRHRKEKREFAKLCEALRRKRRRDQVLAKGGPEAEALRESERESARRYAGKMLERDPERFRARRRAACRRFYRRHKESELQRQRDYRAQKDRENPRICRCRVCGSEWCLLPGRGTGRFPRYCGDACRRRKRRRKNFDAVYRCSVCREPGHDRRNCPSLGAFG